MPFFDVSYSSTGARLMTIEAPSILEVAERAVIAAPHCDGIGRLLANITVRPHVPPSNTAFFTDGWFKLQAELGALYQH